jgi:NitT/TauT family transport system permease protein
MATVTRPRTTEPEQARMPRRSFGWTSIPGFARRTIIVAVLLVAWQVYVQASGISPLLLRSPLEVAQALWSDSVRRNVIPAATAQTLSLLLLGMLAGILGGLLLATLASLTEVGQDILSTLSSMLNPLPAIAILPLAMIWLGLTPQALVLVLVHATIWPIAINTSTGFRTINRTVYMVARNLGLRGVRLVGLVLLPAALPHILTGFKTAWAFGWRTIVAAELVFGVAGGRAGLGFYINNSKTFLDIDKVFAGLVVIAIIGVLIEMVFGLIERQTVARWGMRTE